MIVIAGLYFLAPLDGVDLSGPVIVRGVVLLARLAGLAWLVARQAGRALRGAYAPAERIAMMVTLVAVVVVFFASVYYRMADQFTGLHTRVDSLYFSMATLSTVGYGDLVPVGQGARVTVIVQMLFDLVIVTSAISIVVGALRSPAAAPRRTAAPPPGRRRS